MIEDWHLAQMNVGTFRFQPEDPRLAGFMDRLDDINALADQAPGFVWRLQSDSGNATDIDVGEGPLFVVNMSVWTSVAALTDFVYQTSHRDVMIQRRQWFEKPAGPYQVLWWIAAGHFPLPEEGLSRLRTLAASGPTSDAFSFSRQFPPPSSASVGDRPVGEKKSRRA